MSHGLLHNRMAYVGETPWHRLGKRVEETVSAAAMIKAAGLDWSVKRSPAPGSPKNRRGEATRFVLHRDRIGNEKEEPLLGLVSDRYEILQNRDAFQFFEPLVRTKFAQFHTAGALGNGERVWVQAKLNKQFEITKGDVIEPYLLLSNRHDGKGAVSVRFSPIRVVCQNTLSAALAEGGSHARSSRHSKKIEENLSDMRTDLLATMIEAAYRRTTSQFQKLAEAKIDREVLAEYLERILPRTLEQRRNNTKPERWQRIEGYFDSHEIPETEGTWWAAYNAVTYEEDHRTTLRESPSNRLERIWFGDSADLKLKALGVALDMTGAANG